MILKILKFFFITLGVIFFIIILVIAGFIIFDPFNLRPLISILLNSSETSSSQKTNGHPLLDEKQEKLLETIGVNVGNLPTEITPQMEDCFTRTLGEQRVKEISEGAEPNLNDFLKSRECLE